MWGIYMSVYFDSLELAMQKSLQEVKEYGFITSPRGRESRELLGYSYVLNNPRNRIMGLKARNLNPYYLVGNLFWVLNQSNELDFINYYNPRGIAFSDNGKTLRGGYGKRIFDIDGVNQWYQCLRELKIDKDSRRAAITFHLPQHDWHGSLDTPCTLSVQFFIRENKLHFINHMRSQSAAFVQPYDVFLMTMLQELMACELGVEIGEYHHICGSYHYFTNEERMVDMIIESESNDYTKGMEAMPKETTYESLKPLLYFERTLRKSAINGYAHPGHYLEELKKLNLNNYWYQFGLVLIAKSLHHINHVDYSKFINEKIKDTMFGNLF